MFRTHRNYPPQSIPKLPHQLRSFMAAAFNGHLGGPGAMLDEVRHGMASDIEGDSVPVGVAVDLPVGQHIAIRGAFAARIDEMLTSIAFRVQQHDHRAFAVGDHSQEPPRVILEPRLLAPPVPPISKQQSSFLPE